MVGRAAGFSLVETMVVLSIGLLLLLASVPLTRSWVANARISQADSQLLQAYAKTRALALRNPLASIGNTPAATLLILDNQRVQVREGSSGTLAWAVTAADGVTFFLAEDAAAAAPGCGNVLRLDNNGLPLGACRHYAVSAAGGDRLVATLR